MSDELFEGTTIETPDWASDEPLSPTEPQVEESVETPGQEPGLESPPQDVGDVSPGRARDAHGRFLPQETATEETTEEVVEGEVEEPTTAEEQVKVWAGKYKNPEELEKGYRELRDLQRRTAEARKAEQQRAMELDYRRQQLESTLQQATPIVQQAAQMRQQLAAQQAAYQQWAAQAAQRRQQDPFADVGQPPMVPMVQPQMPQGLPPEQVQAMVNQQVGQQMSEFQRQQAIQAERQKDYIETAENLQEFFVNHPEIQVDGDADSDIAATVQSLNQAWATKNAGTVDIGSSDGLERIYEATKRPALARVLALHPEYIDDEVGMTLARQMASTVDGQTQVAMPATGTTPGRSTPRPNTPVVERGSSPSAPQGKPLDEWQEAVASLQADTKRGSSIFFGG